ncbi:MAG: hypothetical protein NC336_01505 [Clostridium sp.]|nr:hypothetical protein [Clostridium sp.]
MKLSYRNEKDKLYGATGMAIAIVLFDAEELINGVNVDSDPTDMVEYTADYYFSGNPRVSATTSWKTIVRNFNLAVGVSLGNILCRRIVLDSATVDRGTIDDLRSLIVSEGTDTCSLERDEVTHLFEKNYNYLSRVFTHRGVQSVARDFAERLASSRRLSRIEILEQLRALSSL